jgi:molecular chaperone GrpE
MNPAETPDEPTPTVNPVLLQAKVDQLERQVNDYKLLLAEMTTSGRRLREDADKQKKYAAEPVARDLLAVIDNLERAAAGASKAGEAGALSAGVTATITMFLDVMKRHGVKRIETAPGSPFDPNLHMAVMEQPTNDAPAGSVFQVLEQGYLLHDRVLRPATVIVASAPPAGG